MFDTKTPSPVSSVDETVVPSPSEVIDIGILDPEKTEFYITPGGFTGLKYDGTDYPRILLRRALPTAQPMNYISVADKENKEIGILRALSDLSEPQCRIVTAELESRYYCPVICEVRSVKDKLGYVYFELTIERNGKKHSKNCAVKDVSRNIRMLDDERLILFDVDGNRYIINSLSALDKKSLSRLEPYLF